MRLIAGYSDVNRLSGGEKILYTKIIIKRVIFRIHSVSIT